MDLIEKIYYEQLHAKIMASADEIALYAPEKKMSHYPVDLFQAAMCRDIVEGGDGTQYFGSTMSFNSHVRRAIENGLLTDAAKDKDVEELKPEFLTEKGRELGEACRHIPKGRAYTFPVEYDQVLIKMELV